MNLYLYIIKEAGSLYTEQIYNNQTLPPTNGMWQVTAKHAYALSVWTYFYIKKLVTYTQNKATTIKTFPLPMASGRLQPNTHIYTPSQYELTYASAVCTPLRWIVKTRYKKLYSLMQNHMRALWVCSRAENSAIWKRSTINNNLLLNKEVGRLYREQSYNNQTFPLPRHVAGYSQTRISSSQCELTFT